jgi:hypothetical protein
MADKKTLLIKMDTDEVLRELSKECTDHINMISRVITALKTELSIEELKMRSYQESWWLKVTTRLDELKLLAPDYHRDDNQYLNVETDSKEISLIVKDPNDVKSGIPPQVLEMLKGIGVPEHVINSALRRSHDEVQKEKREKIEDIVH